MPTKCKNINEFVHNIMAPMTNVKRHIYMCKRSFSLVFCMPCDLLHYTSSEAPSKTASCAPASEIYDN